MPAAPVITDVARVAILWGSVAGVSPVNVFHVFHDALDEVATATVVAAALDDGTSPDNMFKAMSSGFAAQSIHVTKLNGTSPGIDFDLVGSGVSGGSTGEWIPAASAVVSIKTAQKGPRGRGRMYIGPICESQQTQGVLSPSTQSEMLAGWDAFTDRLAVDNYQLGVASYVHHDFHEFTSVRIDTLIGTMRRRQDQLR